MSNKILDLVNAKLAAEGQKAIGGDDLEAQTTPAIQPQRVQYLPGGLDIFAQNLDQPVREPTGPDAIEATRQKQLAKQAQIAMCGGIRMDKAAAEAVRARLRQARRGE